MSGCPLSVKTSLADANDKGMLEGGIKGAESNSLHEKTTPVSGSPGGCIRRRRAIFLHVSGRFASTGVNKCLRRRRDAPTWPQTSNLTTLILSFKNQEESKVFGLKLYRNLSSQKIKYKLAMF